MEKNNRLNAKDLINVGVYTAICAVLCCAVAMTGVIPIMMVLLVVFVPILTGIPYMMFLAKVKKFGMILILNVLMGANKATEAVEYRMVPLIASCAIIGEELSAAAMTRGLDVGKKRSCIWRIRFISFLRTVCLKRYMMQVSKILKNLKEMGKTVIIVTHDVELIKNACTRVIRFDSNMIGDCIWMS